MVLGLGTWEFVVLGLAMLILFGPEHAPRAIRTLGRWQAKIRNTLEEIEHTLEAETGEGQLRPRRPRELTTTGGPNEVEAAPQDAAATWSFADSEEDEEEPEEDSSSEDPEESGLGDPEDGDR